MTAKSVSETHIFWLCFTPAASWTSLIVCLIDFSNLICIKLNWTFFFFFLTFQPPPELYWGCKLETGWWSWFYLSHLYQALSVSCTKCLWNQSYLHPHCYSHQPFSLDCFKFLFSGLPASSLTSLQSIFYMAAGVIFVKEPQWRLFPA